jgi:hypothetical protein
MKKLLFIILIFPAIGYSQLNVDSLFVRIPCSFESSKIIYRFSRYWDSIQGYKSFTILVSRTITPQSQKDDAAYFFEVPALGQAIDSSQLSHKYIYTPEMIMDSLTKYRYNYERRNRGNFYVIIKGQGPIWYLHKAKLTYLWGDPDSFNNRKKNEEFIEAYYPTNANNQDVLAVLLH